MKTFLVALALLLVVVHVWLSRQLHDGPNEVILADAVQTDIKNEFGEDVTIRYDYLDGVLTGIVPDKATRQAAGKKARELRPAGRIFNHLQIADRPPSLFAGLADGKLILRGQVPHEATKTKIARAASDLGRGEVVNELVVDPLVKRAAWFGVIPGFIGGFFKGTDSGEVDATEEGIRLKRGVRASAHKAELIRDAEKTRLSVVDEIFQIRDQPSKLIAVLQDSVLTLRGAVPSEAIKTALGKEAEQGGFSVVNQIAVREDVMDTDWAGRITGFMGEFFQGTTLGEFEIDPGRIRISREVSRLREKQALMSRAEKLLPGGELVDQLRFPAVGPDFRFGMNRTGDSLKLTGWLSDFALKEKILAATRAKFPGLQIEDEIFVAPNVKMPDWAPSMPDYVGKIPSWDGFEGFHFDGIGLRLPGIPRPKQIELGDLAMESIGAKFPSFSVPRFGFDLNRIGRKIVLSGWLPNASLKSKIIDGIKTKVPNLEIEDELREDPQIEMPEWGVSLPDFVGKIPTWEGWERFKFDHDGIDLEGMTDDAKRAIGGLANTTFATAGTGFPEVEIPPLPPPPPPPPEETPGPMIKPVRSATLKVALSPDAIKLDGEVPDKPAHESILKGVTGAFPDAELTDNLVVSPEVFPTPWAADLGEFFGEFAAHAKEGEINISGKEVEISGKATNSALHNKLLANLSGFLPGEIQIQDRMKVEPSSEPDGELPGFVIYYASGSSRINPTGAREVTDAVDAIGKIEGEKPSILVKGFADSFGDAEANKRLSELRATRVVESLVAQGVDRSLIRYIGVGEGESNDRGSNQSDRRVEIIIVQ